MTDLKHFQYQTGCTELFIFPSNFKPISSQFLRPKVCLQQTLILTRIHIYVHIFYINSVVSFSTSVKSVFSKQTCAHPWVESIKMKCFSIWKSRPFFKKKCGEVTSHRFYLVCQGVYDNKPKYSRIFSKMRLMWKLVFKKQSFGNQPKATLTKEFDFEAAVQTSRQNGRNQQ